MPYNAGTCYTKFFIPNYLPSRQGKSLDFELALFLIKLCKSHKKPKSGEQNCHKQRPQKSDKSPLKQRRFR